MGSTGGGQFGENGQKLRENYKIGILGSKQERKGNGGDQLIFLVVGIFSPVSPPGETLDYPFFILQIIKTWIKKKAEFLSPPSSVYSPVLKTKWILHSSDSLASNLKLILSWTIGN